MQVEGEKVEAVADFIFLGSKIMRMVTTAVRLKDICSLEGKLWQSYDKPTQCIKKHRYHSANKGLYSQSYDFSSSHVWMWELDLKGCWVLNNWCFCIVLKETLESSLDYKEIKSVNSKGNQLGIFIGRTDAEAETLILWPPDGKSRLIGKDPDDWERLRAKGEESGKGWDG